MKLTIKTLVKLTFQVEIEPDKTVKELKETIEKEQGKDYPSGSQKLIYNGKILADENKLSEYEFDEKKFVVLMITRAPPAPKPSANNDSLKQKSDEKSKITASTTRHQHATATNTAATTTPSSTATTTTVSPTPASTTTPATTTASNTASRQPPPPPTSAARNLSEMAGLSMGEPQLASRLAALMTQPHFRQMQDLIQQSPHLLSSTIESLAASDPEMYNFISENPDVFVNALNHPPLAGMRPSGQQQPSGQGRGQAQGGVQLPPGFQGNVTAVGVSEQDREAIDRLKELGFSEYLAVQAYIACDKDEQLAANLLFQMEQ